MSEDYLTVDPWKIVEERFDPERVPCSESLFSLGNGEWGGLSLIHI